MGAALKLLLDSATVIWVMSVPSELSPRARAAIEERGNDVAVSAASAWEIATKHRLGRLEHVGALVADWHAGLARFGFAEMPITHAHALRAGRYEVEHADPFDRVIAAQAELEVMVLVASDRAFDLFPVVRLW